MKGITLTRQEEKGSVLDALHINKGIINRFLFGGLIFFTLLTPADSFGLKKIFLFFTLLFNAEIIMAKITYRKYFSILVLSIVVQIFTYLTSVAITGNPFAPINCIYPYIYILLAIPAVEKNIDIIEMVLFTGAVMCFITLISVCLDFFGIMSIYANPVLMRLKYGNEAQISSSSFAMFRYVIFLKASPILYLCMVVHLKKKQYIMCFIELITLLFSGTRANIVLGLFIIVATLLAITKKKSHKVIIMVMICIVAVIVGPFFYEKLMIINEAKSKGDATRVGTLESVIRVMNEHKYYYIIGMGYGSEYYSTGRNAMVSTSELSYLELIREVGAVFASIIVYYLVLPIFKLYSSKKHEAIFLIAYLTAAIFEPFIFTSTGMLVIMIMYYECNCKNMPKLRIS